MEKVTVELTCSTAKAVIYYTLDGSEPIEKSDSIKSGGSITIDKTSTLKYFAAAKNHNSSAVKSIKYIIKTATPKIPFDQVVNEGDVIVLEAPSDATLYYTQNKEDPTVKSDKINPGESISLTITEEMVVKAAAKKSECDLSNIVKAVYSFSEQNRYIIDSLSAVMPYGWQSVAETKQINDDISKFISGLNNSVPKIKGELEKAVKAVVMNNPVYSPNKVLDILKKSLVSIKNEPNGWAYYVSDGSFYIGKDAMKLERLDMFLANMLNQSIISYNNNKNFSYSMKNVRKRAWSDRISSGLANLYAYSALGEGFITFNNVSGMNLKGDSYITSDTVYAQEQVSAILLCNALGRERTAKAFYGTKKDYDNLISYYEKLTGKSFKKFLGAAEEFVAYSYTYYGEPLIIKETNAAGKKYMNLVLEVLEKRIIKDPKEELSAEIEALISLSPKLHDEKYMNSYFKSLKSIYEKINN